MDQSGEKRPFGLSNKISEEIRDNQSRTANQRTLLLLTSTHRIHPLHPPYPNSSSSSLHVVLSMVVTTSPANPFLCPLNPPIYLPPHSHCLGSGLPPLPPGPKQQCSHWFPCWPCPVQCNHHGTIWVIQNRWEHVTLFFKLSLPQLSNTIPSRKSRHLSMAVLTATVYHLPSTNIKQVTQSIQFSQQPWKAGLSEETEV